MSYRSSQVQKLMTLHLEKSILELMSRRVSDSWTNLPEFVIKMLASNKVVCHKCLNEIELGSYYRSAGSSARIRKYYHPECLERLWQ